jgi:hypothetical protein
MTRRNAIFNLRKEEARRIAVAISRLPERLGKNQDASRTYPLH